MRVKKLIACISLASLLVSSTACTSTDVDLEVAVGMPDFSADVKTVGIDAWLGPQSTDRELAEYVECGYDFTHWNSAGPGFYDNGPKAEVNANMNAAFELCKKYGVKVILGKTAINMGQTSAKRFETYDSIYGETLEKWRNDETFYGVMLYDEPTFVLTVTVTGLNDVTVYEDTGKYLRDEYLYFSSKYPEKYMETVMLGAPAEDTKFPYQSKYPTYADYIGHYYENVLQYTPYEKRVLSMDCYPFKLDRLGKPTRNRIFVQSLADLALEAEKYGVPEKWGYIQTYDYIVNGECVSYQYYTTMAFGYTHFVTYLYGADWGTKNYAVDKMGNRTEMWYYLKNAHDQVETMENVYMRFADGWKGAIAVEGSARGDYNRTWADECPFLKGYDRIQSVEAKEDLIVGVMQDELGYDAFMLANQSLPYGNAENDVEITFRKADKAIVFDGYEQKTVDLTDGKLSIRLKSGGGALVIPVKEV